MTGPDPDANFPDQVIRRISLVHCARGPKGCAKCREMAQNTKFRLLELDYGRADYARPIIQIQGADGDSTWAGYHILQSFETVDEAREYARKHNIRFEEGHNT